jgi:nucleoid DNA-binding protein
MILDNTLTKIINIVIQEVKDKYDVEYSVEQIFNIVNTQMEATKLGFVKGITVHWSRFGKFVYSKRYDRKMETIRYSRELEQQEQSLELSAQDREQLLKEYIVTKAKEKDKFHKESNKWYFPHTDLKTVMATDDKNKIQVKFKLLN